MMLIMTCSKSVKPSDAVQNQSTRRAARNGTLWVPLDGKEGNHVMQKNMRVHWKWNAGN